MIAISNNGILSPYAMKLMGASTKRDMEGQIGMFGSGFKYAIAYFMREKIGFRVITDGVEIPVWTKDINMRGTDMEVICIDGDETSMTTDLGPDWELWQAFREVYCNAIDEGNSHPLSTDQDPDNYLGIADGSTHVFIEETPEVEELLENLTDYFCGTRTCVYSSVYGDLLEKQGPENIIRVYRKGIFIGEVPSTDHPALWDYNFNEISINESRTVKYWWTVPEKILVLLHNCQQREIIEQYLTTPSYEMYCANDTMIAIPSYCSDEWKEFVESTVLATPEQQAVATRLGDTTPALTIPSRLFAHTSAHHQVQMLPSVEADAEGRVSIEPTIDQINFLDQVVDILPEFYITTDDDVYTDDNGAIILPLHLFDSGDSRALFISYTHGRAMQASGSTFGNREFEDALAEMLWNER